MSPFLTAAIASDGLGRDMAGHEAVRGPENRPSVRARLSRPSRPHDCGCHPQHLAHAGTWTAFIPDHDDVAGLDLSGLHRDERIFFPVIDLGGSAELHHRVASDLHDAAVGREIALENDQAPVALIGFVKRQ